MVMTNKFGVLCLSLFMVMFLMACGNHSEEDASASEDEKKQSEEQDTEKNEEQKKDEDKEEKSEEDEESGDVSFEVQQSAPEDQGEMEVWLEGDFTIKNKVVTVNGTTNLLPESELYLDFDWQDGSIIGGYTRTRVNGNGVFKLEKELPNDVEGIIHTELSFDMSKQDEEIQEHYGDKLAGHFLRYETGTEEETYRKASFQKTIELDDKEQSFSIEEPRWKIPENSGNPEVELEPSIEKKGKYVVVTLESNLIGGAYVRADTEIPNYITSGYYDDGYTNPDGSATFYIRDPEREMDDISEYEIMISMDPTHHNNGAHVKDAYGKNGEKLSGEYLRKDHEDKQTIEQTLTVTAE
ncbi:hypothetical protein GCM10008986_14860 [Salinibacillus aidingensis]|uniref:Uncharacterized protein n=2 Tax=Salinibacillus aidingensis TaxID=237684 RepID=A0ABN1B4W8_9BACI